MLRLLFLPKFSPLVPASSGNCDEVSGVEDVGRSWANSSVPCRDFVFRKPDPRGRRLIEGESIPLRISSATTALREDDSGARSGAGVRWAIDRRESVEGRWDVTGVVGVGGVDT